MDSKAVDQDVTEMSLYIESQTAVYEPKTKITPSVASGFYKSPSQTGVSCRVTCIHTVL